MGMKKRMKKSRIAVAVALLFVWFVGCGQVSPEMDSEQMNAGSQGETQTAQTEAESGADEKSEAEEAWGVYQTIVTTNSQFDFVDVEVDFPTLSGITKGTGIIAYQTDDTVVILDSPICDPEEIDGAENVLPEYFTQTDRILTRYDMNRNDNSFEIETGELVTINGYEMYRFTGTYSYHGYLEDADYQEYFSGYAAQVKGNGAYVYWIVFDESEDQSLGATADEYAEKMAYSMKELN